MPTNYLRWRPAAGPDAGAEARRQPVQVRLHRRHRRAQLADVDRGGQLLRQARRTRSRARRAGSTSSKKGFGKTRYNWQYTAAGYAAVWATENTREALWDAMKRKEVYATSGSRMTVRFFGGWDFKRRRCAHRATSPTPATRKGVPMGGDLPKAPAGAKAPTFLVAAMKDPQSGNLDRIQIIKGWLDKDGKAHEKIYDVAWGNADRRKPRQGRQAAARRRHGGRGDARPGPTRSATRSSPASGRTRTSIRRSGRSTTRASSRSRRRAGPPTTRCASASRCRPRCR